jgi:MATE family multidrug resistance protein
VSTSADDGGIAAFRTNAAGLVRLAVPMIVSRAGLAGMQIADAVMVARFNPGQFAILSLADGTLGRLIDIFAAFLLGGLVLVPRAFGAGDLAACARIWRRTFGPALGLGLLGALIGLAGTPIFRLLGQSPPLASGAGAVAAILGLGYGAALFALAAAIVLEGMNRPVIVAASVVGANLLNIGVNWLLIGGHFGLPALGARGSAISTTIVRFALALVLVGYAWTVTARAARATRAASATAATTAAQPELQDRLGWSAAIVSGVILALVASLLVFAGWLGPIALAVLSAAFTLNAPAMLLTLGLADATGIRVATRDGAADGARAGRLPSQRSIVASSVAIMFAVMLLFAVAWSAVPDFFAGLFTADPQLRHGLAAVIPLAGALLLCDGMCCVVVAALRSLRDVVWPAGIEIATLAALVPLAAWLAFARAEGVRGLLAAAVAAAACRAALLTWRFLHLTKPIVGHATPLAGEIG